MAMLLPSRLLEVNSLFKVNFFTTLKTASQPCIGLARPIMILYCQKKPIEILGYATPDPSDLISRECFAQPCHKEKPSPGKSFLSHTR